MATRITVKHNAEMAHRLPVLPGKCQNLHGHSWDFTFTLEAPMDVNGITVEYGQVKKLIRELIDTKWDHGVALGVDDPLLPALMYDRHHSKTYVFGSSETGNYAIDCSHASGFLWPTVEAFANVAALEVQTLLDQYAQFSHVNVVQVDVSETAVNAATWTLDHV